MKGTWSWEANVRVGHGLVLEHAQSDHSCEILPDQEHQHSEYGHATEQDGLIGEQSLLNDSHHRVGQAERAGDVENAASCRL